jgi:hypothetical protein
MQFKRLVKQMRSQKKMVRKTLKAKKRQKRRGNLHSHFRSFTLPAILSLNSRALTISAVSLLANPMCHLIRSLTLSRDSGRNLKFHPLAREEFLDG